MISARGRVLEQWGFGQKFSYGNGISVLFYGAPGTGKTMAAQVLAAELGLPLYRVDLSQLISKYIGETQKNIGQIFDEAERSRVYPAVRRGGRYFYQKKRRVGRPGSLFQRGDSLPAPADRAVRRRLHSGHQPAAEL